MILRALVDYYERKRAVDPAAVAPPGWEYREIAFFIDVADDGSAVLVDRRSADRRRGEMLLVPAAEIRSGNAAWKQPNLLWDHIGFVLGEQKRRLDGTLDPTDKPTKVANQHQAFKARVAALAAAHPDSAGLRAILRFYAHEGTETLGPPELRTALVGGQGLNVTFRRKGCGEPVCHEAWASKNGITEASSERDGAEPTVGPCLVTGKTTQIARLHPKISFVTQKPSPLVAANTNEAPAYGSYGKQQGLNSPVSVEATARYTLALNALLGRGSANKVQIGDATTVIWADRDTTLDAELAAVFGDNPDAHVQAVRDRLTAALGGRIGADDSGLSFFVLGLAPNASRIAVRFWFHDTFERLGPRILQHFDDLRIVRQSDKDSPTPSMKWLLRSLAVRGEDKNVPPRLAGEWLRAILEGTAYPPALLNAAVGRCRAEQSAKDSRTGKPIPNVPYLRAAILKACINREHRRRHGEASDFQFIQEELDVNQTDPAYRLGRLFAVLERIQSAAQPGINSTIRDRFYGAFSATPAIVFPQLMKLHFHHLNTLDDKARAILYRQFGNLKPEDCIGSILEHVRPIPTNLSLLEQGEFALGYYQQRQRLFLRRDTAHDNDTNAQED